MALMADRKDNITDRYSRQTVLDCIGVDGQRRLGESRVTLIGCGALGTVLANTLVRAGVGHLRICDRDFIEPNNLQRQVLFDETDIEQNLPKAVAATNKLRSINSAVTVTGEVADVNHTNIEALCNDAHLVLDGTDNFETRYLINDYCICHATPWIYGAVIGTSGLVMPILPGQTPCLRCVFENAPPPEMNPTCDTAGVLGPAVNVIASIQAVEAIKLLTGQVDRVLRKLISVDVWNGRLAQLNVATGGNTDCICCGRREFEYLNGSAMSLTSTLCGRDAVQIHPATDAGRAMDFDALLAKLAPLARATPVKSDYVLRASIGEYDITVFADGRAIIKGTNNPDVARSVYSRYVGS